MKSLCEVLIALSVAFTHLVAQPTIVSFAPSSGPIGTAVTITGTNFSSTSSNNTVYFGATKATVTGASTTQLNVTVPSGATYQPITVTVNGLTAYSNAPFMVAFGGGGGIDSNSFSTKMDFAAGSNPYGVAIGDVDGDGKPDVAVTNYGSNTVSVFRNTGISGSVSFAPKVDFTAGSIPNEVVFGDIDGDGKLDMAVGNQNSNTVSVFRNTSTSGSLTASSFAAKVDFAAGSYPAVVHIHDIDGDGKSDIVTANAQSNTISVFRNTSSPGSITSSSFAAKVDFTVGSWPNYISINDIDGDSKPDIAVSNAYSNSVSVLRNTSTRGSINTGSFAPKVDFLTSGVTNGVAVGDIDGDGKPDLVLTDASLVVSVYRNMSSIGSITSSSFAAKVDFGRGLVQGSVFLGDIDGDSKLDIAVPYSANNVLSVFKNTSTSGSITTGSLASKVDFAFGQGPSLAAICDVDGDGKPDLVVANTLSNTVSVRRNTIEPPASKVPTIVSFSPTVGPIGTAVTINGTHFSTTAANNIVYFGAVNATVAAATATSLSVTVPTGATYQPISVTVNGLTAYSSKPFIATFAGGGSITSVSFATKVDYGTWLYPTIVAIGDLDGDGKPDLAIDNTNSANNTVSVFRNTSNADAISASSFASKVDFTTGDGNVFTAIGDIDGDGKLDLVVINQNVRTVSVFRNTSTTGAITASSFEAKVDFTTGTAPSSVAIGDLDGDGKPDLVVVNVLSNTVSVFKNTSSVGEFGSNSFALKVDFTTGPGPYGVAICDLDGDGKPELAVTNSDGNTVSVFKNTSTSGEITASSFAVRVDFTTGANPPRVAIGDIDGDGKPDLVVTNSGASTVSIFRNTGNTGAITASSFAAKVDFTTGTNPQVVAIGDVDGDGKPDLAITSPISNTVSILKNTSTTGTITANSFAAKVDFTTGTYPWGVAIGDIDGDGKPDLVVANQLSNTVSVFQNTTPTATIPTTASVAPTGPAQASAGTPFWVEVKVGDPNAVNDLYGISLKLKSNQTACTYVDGSAAAGTFLGTSPLAFFQKVDAQTVDIAVTKTSSPGVTGSGVVAKAQFTTSASLSSTLDIVFSLLGISATNSSGATIQLTSGTLTVSIISGPLVWPGDCSNDGTVNSADLLPIGLYYGQAFGANNSPGTTWQVYPRSYWANEGPGTVKKVYADANGDGIINSADLLPIGLHYGKTHSVTTNSIVTGGMLAKAGQAADGQLDIPSISYRSASEGRLYVPVMLKSNRPIYGVSFRVKYTVEGASAARDAVMRFVETDTAGTVLGGGLMMSRALDEEGVMDVGMTKTAGKGFVGSGELVGIVMNLPANNVPMVRLEICDIKAIDHEGKEIVVAGSVYRGEVSLPTREEHQQPAKFELMANYPNPFNPSTTIMFSLAEQACVTLRIYDVLGREVVTLLDGERTGGVHAVRWDGKNTSGNQVESGVYYCRISARGNSGQQLNQAQRMAFIK